MDIFIAHHEKGQHFFIEANDGSYVESLCKDIIVAKYADEYIESTNDTRRSVRELIEMRVKLGPVVAEKEVLKYDGPDGMKKIIAKGHTCSKCIVVYETVKEIEVIHE